jgi:hypothetical protein
MPGFGICSILLGDHLGRDRQEVFTLGIVLKVAHDGLELFHPLFAGQRLDFGRHRFPHLIRRR